MELAFFGATASVGKLFDIERNLIMEFLTRPITSERLEEKGQSLYKLGKIFSFVGVIGFAVLLLSVLITLIFFGGSGVAYLLSFEVGSEFAIMYLILPLSYIGILLGIIGIPMYFNGLSIFALGRIAHNTEKE